jgi:ribonuclease-3
VNKNAAVHESESLQTAREPASASADAAGGAPAQQRLQERIGYKFSSKDLLERALTHSSIASERMQRRTPQDDNEQLEFLGDAVLSLAVTEHLYQTYSEMDEGALTQLRAQMVSRKHLAQVARMLALGEALRLGQGEERSGGRKKSALLANALEALIAALYLDGGLAAVAQFVRTFVLADALESLADEARAGLAVGDYKSALQEYLQASGLGQPRYTVTAESGPDHQKTFAVELHCLQTDAEPRQLASASGARKKIAEQEAARIALDALRNSSGGAEAAAQEKHT